MSGDSNRRHSGGSVHVPRVETKPYKDFPYGDGPRWCFVCRKRVPFTQTTHVPVDPMNYYGPHWTVQCPKGHVDGDCFPSTIRDWHG